jgi:hypothetical protein
MDTKKLRANVAIPIAELPARPRCHDRSNHGTGYDPKKPWRDGELHVSQIFVTTYISPSHLAIWRGGELIKKSVAIIKPARKTL